LIFGQNPQNIVDANLAVSVSAETSGMFSSVSRGVRSNTLSGEIWATYKATIPQAKVLEKYENSLAELRKFISQLEDFISQQLSVEESDPAAWLANLETWKENGGLGSESDYRDGLLKFRAELSIGSNNGPIEGLPELPTGDQTIGFAFSDKRKLLLDSETKEFFQGFEWPHKAIAAVQTLEGWYPEESLWSYDKGQIYIHEDDKWDLGFLDSDGVEGQLVNLVLASNGRLGPKLHNFRFVDPIRVAPSMQESRIQSNPIAESLVDRINAGLRILTEDRYSYSLEDVSPSLFGAKKASLIRDHFTNAVLQFEDVGSGLGQILPLLEAMYSPNWETLYVEQPELHLHPKMQSELMDLFIDEIAMQRSEEDKQFIIETHSESMLLRLQKRIREGKLKSHEVAILFAEGKSERDSEGTIVSRFNSISEINLDSAGDILDPLPDSFVNLRILDLL
jgi:hypothetical protein